MSKDEKSNDERVDHVKFKNSKITVFACEVATF